MSFRAHEEALCWWEPLDSISLLPSLQSFQPPIKVQWEDTQVSIVEKGEKKTKERKQKRKEKRKTTKRRRNKDAGTSS